MIDISELFVIFPIVYPVGSKDQSLDFPQKPSTRCCKNQEVQTTAYTLMNKQNSTIRTEIAETLAQTVNQSLVIIRAMND
ncbi:unnamed protein product, partial [Mesorhabditis belari]|uniref:Uncharacterized protein n=1 Tax=Mesorhabditis belari TaxID=2138241 RepID=A0AAF3FLP7_9BILA